LLTLYYMLYFLTIHSYHFFSLLSFFIISLFLSFLFFFFLMIRRPPRSTLFPYNDALPICGMVNITSSVNSRERSGINTILHELNPLFTINVTMRDIKSKNVYSRVNSKATTQWRKTESANGVHLEGVASDNRSS